MAGATLLPDAQSLTLEELVADEAGVEMHVRACRPTACCPDCGVSARRRHSWYRRQLGDLPWQGLAVRISLRTRRWFCDTPDCTRRIFTERFPALALPHGRRTARLATLLTALAFALGGRPGARLLAAIGPVVSHDTLINTIRRATEPPAPPPRVLGVDDWSYRRGKVFGTILVDLERRRPIDLLPDRTAASFAAWLKAHPGVEIIARDRGGAYADGARRGAPEAVQVADRFHLVKNLGEVVERLADRQQAAIRAAVIATPTDPPDRPAVATAPLVGPPVATPPTATRATRERAQRQVRRQTRHEEIRALHERGLSQRAIAAALGVARETVARMLRTAQCPQYGPRPPKATMLTPHESYLRARWAAGERNAAILWREVRTRGFTGSAATVRIFVGQWRATPGRSGPHPRHAVAPVDTPAPASAPRWRSPRQVAWLLRRPEGELSPGQRRFLARLPEHWPSATTIRALAQDFDRLVHERNAGALAPWLARAAASGETEFREFAAGLRRDRAAVEAALTLEWSSGQVEGQVNRLKSLKRAMFGRANVDLLRRRVLGMA